MHSKMYNQVRIIIFMLLQIKLLLLQFNLKICKKLGRDNLKKIKKINNLSNQPNKIKKIMSIPQNN